MKEKSGMRMEVKNPDRVMSYFKGEIGILTIVTISGICYNVGMAAGPYFEGQLVQRLYDIMKGDRLPETMISLALIYLGVIIFVQGMRAVKRYGVRIFANDVSRSMRHVLYHCLVHMDKKALEQENMGSLMTKAIADVDACAEGMRKFTTEVFDTGVVMVVYLGMLLALDWRLTLLSLLFTPAAYIIADKLKKKVASANSEYKKSASGLNQMTMDRIGNAVTYRLFGREENRNRAYGSQLADYAAKSIRANIFEGSLAPLYDGIAMIGTVLILYFGAKNVTGTGWTVWNIASFTTYLACFTKLAVKTSHAAKLFNAVQKAEVSWKRIKPFMEKAKNIPPDEKIAPAEPKTLVFSRVTCGYDESKQIRNLTFSAEPGQIIGITGKVASGKSMLGKVLISQVPWTGSIRIGGQNFAEMSRGEKCSAISYMGHEPELLSTTVEENISLGDPVDAAKWLAAVRLEEEVARMPEKEKTHIGMGGSKLSGGQQARLALARTLAHAGSILVLDDPFSAVDPKTEDEILKNIRTLLPDRTILLISHRLSHFPQLDRVLFLNAGSGTFGTHEELMEGQPEYAQLYEKQQRGGDPDEE